VPSFAGALALLLAASPASAERVSLEGICTFICPTGWVVDGFQPNPGTTMVTCKAPGGGGVDAPTLFVGQTVKWGNPNYAPLEKQIKSTGDRFLKREEFLGRPAVFTVRPNRAIVYVPAHGGYFQLGYRAPAKTFDRNSKTFLELMKSFRILGPCDGKTSCRSRRIAVPAKAARWGVSVRRSGSEIPLETSYRSAEHGGSKAEARASVYREGGKCRLVIAVHPEALRKRRAHIEIHYLIEGDALRSAEVMLVELGAEPPGARMDSIALRDAAVPYSEVIPYQASLSVQSLNPCASDLANNSGTLRAFFGHSDVGKVVVDYDTIGVKPM
jgi:hypothetical protein